MTGFSRAGCVRLLCCAALAVWAPAAAHAAPQDPGGTAQSLDRIKDRLDKPAARRLTPSQPVQLRPVFRTRNTDRPFVPTLEEHLRETFELTDFQRQYAAYAARCCGLDIGALVRSVDHALAERRERKVREEIEREIAFIEAARAKPIR